MTRLLLTPPVEGPWTTDRAGFLAAAGGRQLGAIRFERLGTLAEMQAVARYWAASHALAQALVTLAETADRVLDEPTMAEALTDLSTARLEALVVLEQLLDPMITRDTGPNRPIAAVLQALTGGEA